MHRVAGTILALVAVAVRLHAHALPVASQAKMLDTSFCLFLLVFADVSSNVHTLVVVEYVHCNCKIEAVSIIVSRGPTVSSLRYPSGPAILSQLFERSLTGSFKCKPDIASYFVCLFTRRMQDIVGEPSRAVSTRDLID